MMNEVYRKSQIAILVNRRKMCIHGPSPVGREIAHGHEERTLKIRKQLGARYQRSGTHARRNETERRLFTQCDEG